MIDQDSDRKNLRADLTTSAIEAARPELMELALDIHAHHELNYQEYYAANLLSGTLERHGFTVERGIGDAAIPNRGKVMTWRCSWFFGSTYKTYQDKAPVISLLTTFGVTLVVVLLYSLYLALSRQK